MLPNFRRTPNQNTTFSSEKGLSWNLNNDHVCNDKQTNIINLFTLTPTTFAPNPEMMPNLTR